MDQLIRSLLEEVTYVTGVAAGTKQSCLRKTVCSALYYPHVQIRCFQRVCQAVNGPNNGHRCSNVVGGCGCAHSEPRNIMTAIRVGGRRLTDADSRLVMVINYSPCTSCANVIVDSRIIDMVVYGTFTQHDPRGVDILKRACTVLSLEDLELALQADERLTLTGNLVREARRKTLDQLTQWIARRDA